MFIFAIRYDKGNANVTFPEMTYNVFSGTLNPTHSLTHPTLLISLIPHS